MTTKVFFLRNFPIFIILIFSFSNLNASVEFAAELNGEIQENSNRLTWTTSSETNNDYFLVERSINGIDFETAHKVKGKGTSSDENEYSFLDINKKNGRAFYRLVQIDYDGQAIFSHTIVLTRNKNASLFNLTSLNSSVSDRYINLNFDSTVEDDDMSYRIMTQLGNVLQKGKAKISKGTNSLAIDLKGLDVGRYQFALKVKNEITVIQLKKVDSKDLPALNLAIKK